MPDGYQGPINPNPKDDEASIIIYGYTPSLALGIVGTITFAATLYGFLYALMLAQRDRRSSRRPANGEVRTGVKELTVVCDEESGAGPKATSDASLGSAAVRAPTLLWLLASAMEVVGYGVRCASHYRPFVVVTFVVQYFMIVVAPVFICAGIYFTLFALVKRTPAGASLLPFKPEVIITFVIIDVATTILQIAGAALIGTAESDQTQGEPTSITPNQANDILLAGLAGQSAGFLAFLNVLCIVISRALNRLSSTQKQLRSASPPSSSFFLFPHRSWSFFARSSASQRRVKGFSVSPARTKRSSGCSSPLRLRWRAFGGWEQFLVGEKADG